jgi:hypothetical protein
MPNQFEFIMQDELIEFAHVLVEANWLDTPKLVVDFFEKPHKWKSEFQTWDEFGRPRTDDAGWEAFVLAIDKGVEA